MCVTVPAPSKFSQKQKQQLQKSNYQVSALVVVTSRKNQQLQRSSITPSTFCSGQVSSGAAATVIQASMLSSFPSRYQYRVGQTIFFNLASL
jgi:hypothetical protein